MWRTIRTIAREEWLIIGCGIVYRLVWIPLNPTIGWELSETQKIATALATGSGFADAYWPGSGVTAHTSPVMPLLIAAIYRVVGVHTPLSETILSMLSILLVSLSFLLAFVLFRQLGASPAARRAALVITALVPLQFTLEVNQIRSWEAGLTVCMLLGLLIAMQRLDARADVSGRRMIALALATGVLFLVSLPGGVAASGCYFLLIARRLPRHRWPVATAVLVAALLVVNLPWALRNQAEMGRMIWTRSNAWLEFSIAYNDRMLNWSDPLASYVASMHDVHPGYAPGEAAMRAAGGELAYYDQLERQTRGWIARHPAHTVDLLLRHAREYLVPPLWMVEAWDRSGPDAGLRRLVLGGAALLSLIALPLLAIRDRRYLYLCVAVVPLALPYIVAQPIMRYRYLISTLTIFLACDAVARAWGWLQRRRAPGPG